ncbi:MAG: hypothetical protein WA989_16155 [Henriciella sp.]|uniref:hypothetical protein n=1 Tax=Henriciella sp. TaxID=1968823 RepID=UPI003C75B7CB
MPDPRKIQAMLGPDRLRLHPRKVVKGASTNAGENIVYLQRHKGIACQQMRQQKKSALSAILVKVSGSDLLLHI